MELLFRNQRAGVGDEFVEHGPFSCAEALAFTFDQHLAMNLIDLYAGKADRWRRLADIPPGNGQHAGTQLTEIEWLDQIVVGPAVQSFDAIGDLVVCRQDDDGRAVAPHPQRAQER
ncbi:hypothetical protein D9M70_617810 [compost metagenome]